MVDDTAVSADLRYDETWLHTYERLAGTDAMIAAAEMRVAEACLRSRFDPAASRLRHLDLGTCTGRYLRWSHRHGFALSCGVDASPDSVRFCRELLRPGRIVVEHADFREPAVLTYLGERYGPFHLVTVMMGTVNHVPCAEQAALFARIAGILSRSGRLLVSSWRPGGQLLSLYGDAARRRLSATPLSSELCQGPVDHLGLRRCHKTQTPWHDVFEYRRLGDPS